MGPLARTVADAAIVLSIIAGKDPLDNFTLAQPAKVPDYTQALDKHGLKGARIGVVRQLTNLVNVTDEQVAFNASVEIIKKLGATVIENAIFPDLAELRASGNESIVTQTDFKVSIAVRLPHSYAELSDAQMNVQTYLEGLLEVPTGVRTLADLIAFNTANPTLELVPPFYTSQAT